MGTVQRGIIQQKSELGVVTFCYAVPVQERVQKLRQEIADISKANRIDFPETDPSARSARTLIITVYPMNLRFGLATRSPQ
jgi:hypothetical protein